MIGWHPVYGYVWIPLGGANPGGGGTPNQDLPGAQPKPDQGLPGDQPKPGQGPGFPTNPIAGPPTAEPKK